MEEHPYPITVQGGWTPAQSKAVKNKLQLYFQSKKKSNGGECRVEAEDDRATVHFKSDEVRQRVLARENHEITLENESVKLQLFSQSIPPKSDDVSDVSKDSPDSEGEPGTGGSGADKEEAQPVQSLAVVLDNVSDSMSRDLLSMLVENVSGLDESGYSLEIIWEANRAVVSFNNPTDVERFLTVSQSSMKLQKHGLTARLLEAAKSVRVESLPPTVVKEMLELFFEKSWVLPVNIIMIPEEQAATVTFDDPEVVRSISKKEDHVIRSVPVKLYPYYESLGTALYGKERPTWKMPEPFTESVHHAVWKFLLMKKLLKTINEQMSPYFCSVDLDKPEVKLSPLPTLLRQKGLTARHVDEWMGKALEAFRQLLAQYTAFECAANAPAWKAAEKDVHSVVKEDAVLVMDASRGTLTVAGRADDMKRIRAPVENIVLRAMNQIERQRDGVSEVMDVSPPMFYILKQEGLQKAALDISPELILSYQEDTKKLTISGLSAEVYQVKAWILERNMRMSKKQLDVDPHLLDFLKTVDSMEMSQDLFTSQGISAFYSIESRGVVLTGSSDNILADAERKVKMVLSQQTVHVEDQEVMRMPKWMAFNQQLLDTYNSSKKRTVVIQTHPERRDKITVAGFLNPVKEVSRSLNEFVVNYSRVQEVIRVKSCAVVQFIQEKKDWTSIAKANEVTVNFNSTRPRINISGARLHVQKAKASFQELAAALFTDDFSVDKPGAKKYFLSQGSLFLFAVMKEFSCVVVLRPENEEEEEEEYYEEEYGLGTSSYCKVQTASGVLVSVSKADICSFKVDAVVNAANEDLQHIGGLTKALLEAAGPQLQKLSNDYISKNGRLRPGDAVVTDSCNLPCKYVVHAVGPRFSDSDKKTAVSRLKLAVKESLRQAAAVNCSTVALPAISSGVFGFPLELCVETIAQAVRECCESRGGLGSLTEIHLVDNNDNTVRSLAKAVNKEFSDLGPETTLPEQVDERGRGSPSGSWGRGQGAYGGQSLRSHGMSDRRGGQGRGAGRSRTGSGIRGLLPLSPKGNFRPAWAERAGFGRVEQDRISTVTPESLKIILRKGNIQDQFCFAREFRGQTQGNIRHEASDFDQSPRRQPPIQSQQSSVSFGQVSSPSLGVYQMQIGHLSLEVSSGDITKETSDVIVNSTNKDFNLKSGVSKAILNAAGLTVQLECSQIVNASGYQQCPMILTSAGLLPSRCIIHIIGQNDPAKIKEVVYSVLKTCEENKFSSVSFPALGTGQGGASPSAVADAMVDAVVDFVRKKHQRFVRSVKILIFQTAMVKDFHSSMRRREGEEVEEKSVFTKFRDSVTSIFMGISEERPRGDNLVLEGKEFEPAMFQMCADNIQAVGQAKQRIKQMIVAEQAEKTITDPFIAELSQANMEELKALQRKLTVSIRLERRQGDQEPHIHLEGLTRDVFTAESAIRDIIQKVERTENLKQKAILVSGLVEWQYLDQSSNAPVSFDMFTNCSLEEALEKRHSVKIKINNKDYAANVMLRKAVTARGDKEVELLRKNLKDDAALPAHWEDMKGSQLKRFALPQGSKEYSDVQQELQKTGLGTNIISIERVQNKTLWQSYQLMKKQLEEKNKHKNNEKQLFHGTGSKSIDLINSQGFNRSYAGAHGAMLGNGSYFAVGPAYSAGGYAKPDAARHKCMYLARVLVGDFTQGRAGIVTPPSKGSGPADLYDSVTDNTANPTMFVIFSDIQAYPEYLITFT
ncbi:protein mono-ADP-ribosyltransferase PARP14-like [Centroberyx affinis]|uniref:protein mono-ADP-ribosyltransferase PARP14-like n=1 Tax=Centroberyx affinis TaxID=166261 RepID=UPI003A5C3468